MKSFLTKLLDSDTKNQVERIRYWRERILNAVLIIATIAGGVAYAVNLNSTIEAGNYSVAALYTVAYGWAVVITIFRKIAYPFRAGTLVAAFYVVGIISALIYGSAGDARIWLIGVALLTTAFFGALPGIIATVVSTATLISIGFLMHWRLIPAPDLSSYLDATDLFPWTSTSIPFFLTGILAVASFSVIINSLKSSLEKANELTAGLEEDRVKLQRRTQALERRELQIRTAAEISRAINVRLDTETILEEVVNLVKERFKLYYVGVFMLDERGQFATLRVGTGEAGQEMVEDGHKLVVGGSSMIGWATAHRQARIALDVGEEAVRFENPYLPLTRSELALPIISEDRVLGAMSIQSTQPEAFDEDDIIVLQGIADSLATAIDNARLLRQTQESLRQIQALHRQYLSESWEDVTRRKPSLSYTHKKEDAPAESDLGETVEVPITLRGQVLGTITVERGEEEWTQEDKAFLESIGAQAALALENTRLVEETQQSALFNRTVADVTNRIWQSTDIDTILRTSLRELSQILQATDGFIQLNLPEEKPQHEIDVIEQ
jgi:GAF domain-containing protein